MGILGQVSCMRDRCHVRNRILVTQSEVACAHAYHLVNGLWAHVFVRTFDMTDCVGVGGFLQYLICMNKYTPSPKFYK